MSNIDSLQFKYLINKFIEESRKNETHHDVGFHINEEVQIGRKTNSLGSEKW